MSVFEELTGIKIISKRKEREVEAKLNIDYFRSVVNEKIKLEDVPEEEKTSNFYSRLIEYDFKYLNVTPEHIITEEFLLLLVKQSKYIFRNLPDKYKTYKLCLETVKLDAWSFEYIPEEFKTKEICFRALSLYRDSEIIPKNIKNYDFFKEYICCYDGLIFKVPEEFQTEELCLMSIALNPTSINYIPDKYKTYELYLNTVKNLPEKHNFNLSFIPPEFRTEEISLLMEISNSSFSNSSFSNSLNPDIFPISRWKVDWFRYLSNVELRRRFIRERGIEVIKQLSPQPVEERDGYCLIKYKITREETRYNKALIFKCPSSGDTYFSEVPSKLSSINGALKFLNNGVNKFAYES